MARIYLVRHGENPANIQHLFSSRHVDFSLTPKGVLQAECTATYFSNLGLPIDGVYASPLKRARETAEVIAKALSKSVTIIDGFREVDVGLLEFEEGTRERWDYHDSIFRDWFAGKRESRFPEGDDHFTLTRRMHDSLRQVISEHPTGRSIVASHGGIFYATIQTICPDVDMKKILTQWVRNCSITELELELVDGQVCGELIRWGDASHLTEDLL